MVISEKYCDFIVLNYKGQQTIIALITEDKVTELFCIANDFCKFFDAMMAKYALKPPRERNNHRDLTLSKSEALGFHQMRPCEVVLVGDAIS